MITYWCEMKIKLAKRDEIDWGLVRLFISFKLLFSIIIFILGMFWPYISSMTGILGGLATIFSCLIMLISGILIIMLLFALIEVITESD